MSVGVEAELEHRREIGRRSQKQWRENHPDRYRLHVRRRNARGKAERRLAAEYPERFSELYHEELRAAGYPGLRKDSPQPLP